MSSAKRELIMLHRLQLTDSNTILKSQYVRRGKLTVTSRAVLFCLRRSL
jgi:hypothetical protein